jgi:hypothetical protein
MALASSCASAADYEGSADAVGGALGVHEGAQQLWRLVDFL